MNDSSHFSDDFILDCERRGEDDNWDFTCTVQTNSVRAKEKFGDCELGKIILMYDDYTLKFLHDKYSIDEKRTIVLDLLFRNKDCDKENELRGIVGFNMLCSLLNEKIFKDFDYIFLIAISPGLIKFYKKFGFVSLSEKNPEQMIALVMDIKESCSSQVKLPVFKQGGDENTTLREMDTE